MSIRRVVVDFSFKIWQNRRKIDQSLVYPTVVDFSKNRRPCCYAVDFGRKIDDANTRRFGKIQIDDDAPIDNALIQQVNKGTLIFAATGTQQG